MNALARLRSGSPVFGLTLTYPSAAIAEAAIWAGWDFLLLDSEHGVEHEPGQLEVLRTASGTDAFVLVRIRPGDRGAVARYLDLGAHGILVPDVRTGAQAEAFGGPAALRWTGGLRANRYAGPARAEAGEPLVIALVESAEGVRNVEAILDAPGIGGVVVGAGDLSLDLGLAGDFAAADFVSAVETVECAARCRNMILGAKPDAANPVGKLVARGHRLFLLDRDMPLIRSALAESLANAKAALAPRDD